MHQQGRGRELGRPDGATCSAGRGFPLLEWPRHSVFRVVFVCFVFFILVIEFYRF